MSATVPSAANSGSEMPPRVWLLLGSKAGDNNQVQALAEALGWPHEEKNLRYRHTELLSNVLLPPNLYGIRRGTARSLAPPWPDLVISAGRRNEPVARWIKKQTGGRTRIVHLGRPWASPGAFDLVITTPQYRVPPAPNVLLNELPLHRISRAALARARTLWAPRLASLPRPRIAVLIGGHSGPFTFDVATARRLGQAVQALADEMHASVMISTSRRTPPAAAAAVHDCLSAPTHTYLWTPAAEHNPYFAYLAVADAVVVTGESMSMLAEACATAKPVYIFDLDGHPMTRPGESAPDGTSGPRRGFDLNRYRWAPLTHRLAMALAPSRMQRDVRVLHRKLVESGRAAWLGEALFEPRPLQVDGDLQRAAARVRALFRR